MGVGSSPLTVEKFRGWENGLWERCKSSQCLKHNDFFAHQDFSPENVDEALPMRNPGYATTINNTCSSKLSLWNQENAKEFNTETKWNLKLIFLCSDRTNVLVTVTVASIYTSLEWPDDTFSPLWHTAEAMKWSSKKTCDRVLRSIPEMFSYILTFCINCLVK